MLTGLASLMTIFPLFDVIDAAAAATALITSWTPASKAQYQTELFGKTTIRVPPYEVKRISRRQPRRPTTLMWASMMMCVYVCESLSRKAAEQMYQHDILGVHFRKLIHQK